MIKFTAMKKYNAIILSIIFCIISANSKAQSHPITDSTVVKWSRSLSVSRKRALEIFTVLNYRSAELKHILSETNFPNNQKAPLLQEIMSDRRHKIDSAFTLAEKKKIYQISHDNINQAILQRFWKNRRDSLWSHQISADSLYRKRLNHH